MGTTIRMTVITMQKSAESILPYRCASLRNSGLTKKASMYAEIIAPTKGSTINADRKMKPSTTDIGFAVQSKENVAFTFNCGSETLGISTGGLTSGSRICQFNTPGSVEVWIKADGVICAQKTLTVQASQTAKTCYIDPASVKRDLANYYYDARVQFTGFSPDDKLVWICGRTTATHTLGGEIGGPVGMPLYSDIYCDFNGRPTQDSIEVSIGNFSCGSISTR